MQAVVLKYKVNRTAKKALFIRNGTPRDAVEIQIGKTLNLETALEIAKRLGRL